MSMAFPVVATMLMLLLLCFFSKANAVDNFTSFSFPSFQSSSQHQLTFQGDAIISHSDHTLQLTKTNATNGNPLTNSVGRVVYSSPVHIWQTDATTATTQTTYFETTFTLSITSPTRDIPGNGLTFFLAPVDSVIPPDSDGGFFGLFTNNTVEKENSTYQTIAVEFDTYIDGKWDPGFGSAYKHIGIDVNSVSSRAAIPWYQIRGSDLTVTIKYAANNKVLYVSASYPDDDQYDVAATVDLAAVLPEYAWVGFSASTGDSAVENHYIKSWTFSAWLNIKSLTANNKIMEE